MTLSKTEFIRRFLLHVLPKGLVRIRYYGFLGQAVKKEKLQQCRELLGEQPVKKQKETDMVNSNEAVREEHSVNKLQWCCPLCGKGRLVPYRQIPRPQWTYYQRAAVE